MSNIARYASGAPLIPFANTDTTTAKEAVRGVALTLSHYIRLRNHLFIQVGIFAIVLVSLAAHLSFQNQQANVASQLGVGGVSAVDQLSSTEVAAVVALTTDTMIAEDVVNVAEQVSASQSVAATSEDFLSKPAVAATDDKSSEGISRYKVKRGDTLNSIARSFGVSKDTILWANDINPSDIKKGLSLRIPPVDGVVYTVKSGDNARSIASKFGGNASRIIAFNDAELTGFKAGQRIIIPGGEKPEPVQNTAPAPTGSAVRDRVYTAAANVSSEVPRSGSSNNGYAYGYCTWGVANLVGVPRGWGNANQWAASARAAGFTVNNTPKVGAIAQTTAGWGGHVGLVVGVKGNQIIMKDMNGPAGWGVYGTGTYPAGNYTYIHL